MMLHFQLKRGCTALAWLLSIQLASAHAAPVQSLQWNGRAAYRLSDGKTEAIMVPELSGRVMSFGAVGGFNWLWNAPDEVLKDAVYKNYGGDKTFVAPQEEWRPYVPETWPPDPSWDGPPFETSITPEGHLLTRGREWRGFRVRIEREFWFEKGDFVVRQSMEKVGGEPRLLSIWNVTQLVTPDRMFVPLNPDSAYKNGYQFFGKRFVNPNIQSVAPNLLAIRPDETRAYKIGADSPHAAIIAVRGAQALRLRTEISADGYPNGAPQAGFPVEFYNHKAKGAAHYVELELPSPRFSFSIGQRFSHTIRWSLHALAPQVSLPDGIVPLLSHDSNSR